MYDLNGLAYTRQPEALAFILKLLESDYEGSNFDPVEGWGYSDFEVAQDALVSMELEGLEHRDSVHNYDFNYVKYRAAVREYVRQLDLPKLLAKERARE
ncbi:MAG: hypothetical protein H6555_06665 [Lewinellaceae bacterium]|nr:hypothetical protein [Lewinellaceae bacterium]